MWGFCFYFALASLPTRQVDSVQRVSSTRKMDLRGDPGKGVIESGADIRQLCERAKRSPTDDLNGGREVERWRFAKEAYPMG